MSTTKSRDSYKDIDGFVGLCTPEAFEKLVDQLNSRLHRYRATHGRNWKEIIRSSISTRSVDATITWSSLLLLFAYFLIIMVFYSIGFSPRWNILPEAFVILVFIVVDLSINIWYNYKRVNEMPMKLEKTINEIKDLSTKAVWSNKSYPDLNMPYSPCITLQWCYRDGYLVNLPSALLVPGDLILLNPGQRTTACCHLLLDSSKTFEAGEIFSTSASGADQTEEEIETIPPKLHEPLSQRLAVVDQAPYLDIVDLCLRDFLIRPNTYYSKERHLVVTRIIECIIVPLGFMSFLALGLVRMFYLPHWLGIRVAPWADILFLQPMAATFPLLPVALPVLVALLESIGSFHIHDTFSELNVSGDAYRIDKEESEDCSEFGSNYELNLPSRSAKYFRSNFFTRVNHYIKGLKKFFLHNDENLHRCQKLHHILASATAFCCVDKKGVLSLPNPTAEKIFFLRNDTGPKASKNEEDSESFKGDAKSPAKTAPDSSNSGLGSSVAAEVLDITNDNDYRLHFDDKSWQDHLSNLKPIGLNILLNTCHEETTSSYTAFHNHLCNQVSHARKRFDDKLIVPVTSRRCLCEVSSLIGFVDKARSAFEMEQQLCSFRHIESDQLSRDKLKKAKIKFPFPHMMGVVVKERTSQSLQLMTQGTGDLILDCCEDFWDGKDLRRLTDSEKKLILDFYQRTSLTSICTAFGYKPLNLKISSKIASKYLELPPFKGLSILPFYGLCHFNGMSLTGSKKYQDTLLFSGIKDSSISTDCLFAEANKVVEEHEVQDLQGCIRQQLNQVFIGMVSMQYQACKDVVCMIEALEQACIRFVHFSKENELRSRVFSEKMGLESGWNCHISLSDNRRKSSSSSASSAKFISKNKATITQDSRNSDNSENLLLKVAEQQPYCKNNRITELQKCERSKSADAAALLLPRSTTAIPNTILRQPIEFNDNLEGVHFQSDTLLSPTNVCKYYLDKRAEALKLTSTASPDLKNSNVTDDDISPGHVRFDATVNADVDDDKPRKSFSVYPTHHSFTELNSCSSAVISPMSDSYNGSMTDFGPDQVTPLTFDMANRAQLPIGIEQVRPHLENVDNVPLLVSLFADCNEENTREMLSIMQDYGEVTLVLGSGMNAVNKKIFLQGDASVALHPLYPEVCMRMKNSKYGQNEYLEDDPAPTDVAFILNSLPCSLRMNRDQFPMFHSLIAESRHFMNNCFRTSLKFWVCSNLSLTFLSLLSLLLMLPPLFSLGDAIWIVTLILPVQTFVVAMAIFRELDKSTVMSTPSWKNQCQLDRQTIWFAVRFYAFKFIPSIVYVAAMATLSLLWMCDSVVQERLESGDETIRSSHCTWVYPTVEKKSIILRKLGANSNINLEDNAVIKDSSDLSFHEMLNISSSLSNGHCISTWSCENFERLLLVQQFSMFFMVVYIAPCFMFLLITAVIISGNLIYPKSFMWRKTPVFNPIWLFSSILSIILQALYGLFKVGNIIHLFPPIMYAWAVAWIPILITINEIIKLREIKITIRQEKRARLDFGTRLGLNSPF